MYKMNLKSKGMKVKEDVKASHSPKELDKKASMAPMHKPSMKHAEPSYKLEEGAQSKSPEYKKQPLPLQDAPTGVKGVNEGVEMPLPKSGGVGESEV